MSITINKNVQISLKNVINYRNKSICAIIPDLISHLRSSIDLFGNFLISQLRFCSNSCSYFSFAPWEFARLNKSSIYLIRIFVFLHEVIYQMRYYWYLIKIIVCGVLLVVAVVFVALEGVIVTQSRLSSVRHGVAVFNWKL